MATGGSRESLTECVKAFESVLKAICEKRSFYRDQSTPQSTPAEHVGWRPPERTRTIETNPTHSTSGDQRSSSRLVRCLRKERCQDLLHVLALTLGAVWSPIAMLRKWLDTIKHMMAVATTILVGRHAALHIRHRATDGLPARPFRSGIGKVQATLVIRLRPSRWLAA